MSSFLSAGLNVVDTVVRTTVFSDGPGGGNPCPVVLDVEGLSAEQGMALARRFMSETVRVTSAGEPGADFRFRYFVPRHEMEMCVHATIAAVTVLLARAALAGPPARIETALGSIAVEESPPVRWRRISAGFTREWKAGAPSRSCKAGPWVAPAGSSQASS